ncbi:hypothetical protein [Bosea sp. AS-1]|jgi:hypothetical protein|uniref:hypothetical protein n=1 Tax=Bosea sp. AS-1 TaxID=2015316 RepID=UPI000B795901|nr:hypothetical protein [Bosea sp. AS-1]
MMMRRSIARLAAVGGVCLLGFAARAEMPANSAAYIDASVDAVDSMVKVERGKAGLPRLADPVDGKVLEDVWNEAAILGKGPYVAADVPALLNIVQKQTRILQAYTLYSPDPGKTPPNTAKNTVEYQDEITRTRAFLLKTTAASVQAASDFEARLTKEEKTDSRIQGLRQMRVGLFEIISGVALDLRNPGLREPNQALLARALAENAAGIVAGTAPADRKALVTALQAAKPVLKPAAEKSVATFVAAATSAPCEGLCLLP